MSQHIPENFKKKYEIVPADGYSRIWPPLNFIFGVAPLREMIQKRESDNGLYHLIIHIMKNLSVITFKGLSIVLGEAHFIAQSTADVIVHTEGYIGSKLTAESKSSVIAKRRALTKDQQKNYKACAKTFKGTFANKFKAVKLA